jgi:hypothetical protein
VFYCFLRLQHAEPSNPAVVQELSEEALITSSSHTLNLKPTNEHDRTTHNTDTNIEVPSSFLDALEIPVIDFVTGSLTDDFVNALKINEIDSLIIQGCLAEFTLNFFKLETENAELVRDSDRGSFIILRAAPQKFKPCFDGFEANLMKKGLTDTAGVLTKLLRKQFRNGGKITMEIAFANYEGSNNYRLEYTPLNSKGLPTQPQEGPDVAYPGFAKLARWRHLESLFRGK